MRMRNSQPEQTMLWIALLLALIACFTLAMQASGQEILRPPLLPCTESELFWCEMFNLNPCPCGVKPDEIGRVAPVGPPIDVFANGYVLPKTIGVTQLAYEPEPINPPRLAHMTSYEVLDEILPLGFGSLTLWMDAVPFEGMGEWCWQTYYGYELCADYSTPGLEMERFWDSLPDGFVLYLRPQSMAWTWYEENPCIEGDAASPQIAMADYYAIAKRLYDLIGDRAVDVVLTDWEQDWASCHTFCPGEVPAPGASSPGQDFMMHIIDQRQADVERARREAFFERGYRPKLRVYHAVTINKYPANAPDWPWPYLAERINDLEHRPDFILVSYWKRGVDPRETFDWISDVTGYPPHRIGIAELGAPEGEQEARFLDYVPMMWEWGVRVITIWHYKQTWCAAPVNWGLWKQAQPCAGKVEWTEPTDGFRALMEVMK